jgi:hypothetical protein
VRNAQGYTIVTGPGPGTGEWDTYTCAHCNRPRKVQHLQSAADMPDVCHLCGSNSRPSFICPLCLGKGCDPFEEKLKRMEAKNRFLCEAGA